MAWNPNVPTVTNRVQDDLNAIRANFQHLDPLAQAVGELQAVSGLAPVAGELQAVSGLAPVAGELQAVSGLAPVAGELQAVSELAPYIQALLDSRIVEMGSNANGEYVRWENGLQVCWREEVVGTVQDFPDTFNNLDNRTYPASFSSDPNTQISVGVQSDTGSVRGAFYIAGVGGTNGWGRLCLVRHGSATGSTQGVVALFVAIGRWK